MAPPVMAAAAAGAGGKAMPPSGREGCDVAAIAANPMVSSRGCPGAVAKGAPVEGLPWPLLLLLPPPPPPLLPPLLLPTLSALPPLPQPLRLLPLPPMLHFPTVAVAVCFPRRLSNPTEVVRVLPLRSRWSRASCGAGVPQLGKQRQWRNVGVCAG